MPYCLTIEFIRVNLINKTYYSISDTKRQAYNKNVYPGTHGFITFKLDKVTEEYERIVYSILDMFGYIGGLYDFISLVGFFFVSGIQSKLLYNQILSKLYQVEDFDSINESRPRIEDLVYDVQMNKVVQNSARNIHHIEESKIDLNIENKFSEVQISNQEPDEISLRSSDAKVNDVSGKIKSRRAYDYKCLQFFPFSQLLKYCQK